MSAPDCIVFIATTAIAAALLMLPSYHWHGMVWWGVHRWGQDLIGIVAIHTRAVGIVVYGVGVAMI